MTSLNKRIVHLTSVHSAADVRIFHKECRSLVRAGYKVSLIAPGENGKTIDGVEVVAVKKFRWMPFRLLFTVPAVAFKAILQHGDVYHLHDPELLTVGVLLKMLGKKVIYDVHEDYPRQIIHKSWVPFRLGFLVSLLMRTVEVLAVFFLDRVVAVTLGIAANFPSGKSAVVKNYPILSEIVTTEQTGFVSRSNSFAYVGGLTEIRGCREMRAAIDLIPQELHAELILAGRFSPEVLKDEVLDGFEKNPINYCGFVGRKEIAKILGRCKAGVVVLHPVTNYIESLPIKMFEYMAAGLPVIASDFPEWRKIIQQHDCGLLVDPLDPAAIAQAMRWVIENTEEAEAMGQRGKQAVVNNYRWDIEEKTLLNVYRELE